MAVSSGVSAVSAVQTGGVESGCGAAPPAALPGTPSLGARGRGCATAAAQPVAVLATSWLAATAELAKALERATMVRLVLSTRSDAVTTR